MTTAQDLLIVSMGVEPDAPVHTGDLSLALAGAELVDLVEAEAVTLDGDLIVPGLQPATGDRLLDDAASSLVRQQPYESTEDWLWRRGRGLASAYLGALESDGLITRARGRWLPVPTGRRSLTDSPLRRHAEERRASGEPVLAALAAAVGIEDKATDSAGRPEAPDDDLRGAGTGDAVEAVLAAVGDAVTELESVRQRRTIEDAAFDNVWRAP
ncbi:GPP34 family phosphoprotein [Streptomyces sp. NPDC050287]|uniref:GOLPH3/VPS74 family protein n=1 Tax=Streptomyces sp. NPDC050287 TaxID=3365608 RepID=UPI0037A47DB4